MNSNLRIPLDAGTTFGGINIFSSLSAVCWERASLTEMTDRSIIFENIFMELFENISNDLDLIIRKSRVPTLKTLCFLQMIWTDYKIHFLKRRKLYTYIGPLNNNGNEAFINIDKMKICSSWRMVSPQFTIVEIHTHSNTPGYLHFHTRVTDQMERWTRLRRQQINKTFFFFLFPRREDDGCLSWNSHQTQSLSHPSLIRWGGIL